jgi:uncharacterized protein YecE (DUF72 family)
MILVGTCSWADKSTIKSGEFYPQSIKTSEERLRYYASRFRTLEIDSTYYAIPPQRNVSLWAERTPHDFIFHVKAYSALTGHGVDVKALPQNMRNFLSEKEKSKKFAYIKDHHVISTLAEQFLNCLAPVIETEKLGLIVFQYPPWFYYSRRNMDYILFSQKIVRNLPIGIEFRHGSWLVPQRRAEVLNFLKKHHLIYITADEPQYGNLTTIPFAPDITTEIAYLRLHGRNKDTWLKKGIETSLRYKYLYSDEELKNFVPPVKELSRKASKVYVMFNNCHGGFAMKNALSMMNLLDETE